MSVVKKYTKEILISELKRFFIINHRSPTTVDFTKNKNFPSNSVYLKHFNTWNDALIAANLDVNTYHSYTKDELTDALKCFYIEYNRTPTVNDFRNNKKFPSTATYIRRFGSWNNALNEAKLELYNKSGYTDEELLNELKKFWNKTGTVPTTNDFRNNKDFPSDKPYKTHFGSWNNALTLAGLPINQISRLTGDEQCYICKTYKTHKTLRWYYKDGERICDKCYKTDRNYLHGILNPASNVGIGVITEYIVSKGLNDCTKCNISEHFLSEYDLISDKYGNINVKSAVLRKVKNKNSHSWKFRIHSSSKIPNNYMCLGFNEDRSQILKFWIIPGNSELINTNGIQITNSERGLKRALQYETNSMIYNEFYQNLNIYSLPEFKNLKH